MTTLIEFKGKIEEIRAQLQAPSNSLQKQQVLLQSLKDLCAHTLEQRDLTPEFEQTVMTELLAVEKELKQIKKQNIAIAAKPAFPSAVSSPIANQMPEIAIITNEKQQFQKNTDLPPSSFAPVTDSSNMWQTVPTSAFDPSSSPILRRLMNKEPIHGSKLSGGIPNAMMKQEVTESSNETSREPLPSPLMQEVEKHLQEGASPENKPSSMQNIDDIAPFPETSPFPAPASSFPKPILKSALLEIAQFKTSLLVPPDPVFRLGRDDFEQLLKNFNLGDTFFSAILPKTADGIKGPTEHFVIEQPTPGEFILRDRANQQKTYFNGVFVNEKGSSLKNGDSFIIPVLIKNQLSSLSIVFKINP